VPSYSATFKSGFLHRIHGRITPLPATLVTEAPRLGLFKVSRSQNGNIPHQARFYGLTESVGVFHYPTVVSETNLFFAFIAGAGKSILWYVWPFSPFLFRELKLAASSAIIEDINDMRKRGLAMLAFFYCDFRDDPKKDRRGLLSSLLLQLCDQSDSYSAILSSFYSSHRSGTQGPTDKALAQCLNEMLKSPGQAPVYIVLDALDECSNTSAAPSPREKVLMFVKDLVDSRFPNLHICVTSRPESDIKVVLDPLDFHSVSIHGERGQRQDIDDYIKSFVDTDSRMQHWKAADKQLVIDVLTKKADGM
jgi:hypothetical protein